MKKKAKDPKDDAQEIFEEKKVVRMVFLDKDLTCTRCRIPMWDLPVGWHCGTCGYTVK